MKNIETLYSLNEHCTGCKQKTLVLWSPSVMLDMHYCKHCMIETLGNLVKQEEEWRDALKEV